MSKILVVDDDSAVLEMFVDLLKHNGYDARPCKDGRQALDELTRDRYDLLLLDVLIPKMNGFALIEQLRNDPTLRDLPVIMMSGIYKSRNHRNEMMTRHQVLDYLDKPVAPDALIDLVYGAVGPGEAPPDSVVLLDESSAPAPAPTPTPELAKLLQSATKEERRQVESAAKKEFTPSALLLSGSLKGRPVPAVLGSLWRERQSGALLLRHEKVKKIVFLQNGDPFFVKSNLVSECLGQILVRERLISEEECAESIGKMQATGRKQGEILVEMRSITEKNLSFALEMQAETKLFDTFAWTDGEYRFNPSAELPTSRSFEMSGATMIVEGIRRSFDETRLRELMLPVFDVPLTFRSSGRVDFSPLGLTPKELVAAENLMLPQTTRSLITNMPLDPPEALRLIYSLLALELCGPARA